MTGPKVSVVVPTMRLGGIDVLFDGLARQTFRDYELILVDEWQPLRGVAVKLEAERLRIPIAAHLKPDRPGLAHALNLGLRVARGSIVCPLNDYHSPPPTWLERHWRVYHASGGKWTVNGFAVHHAPPPLKERGQPMTEYAVSLFRETASVARLPVVYVENLAWTKTFRWGIRDSSASSWWGSDHYTSTGREYYNTLNNSIPRDVLLKLNGYDERYDESRAVLDIDAGLRAEAIGHRFVLDASEECAVHAVSHDTIDAAFGDLWKQFYSFRKPHEENLRYLAARLEEIEEVARARKGLA